MAANLAKCFLEYLCNKQANLTDVVFICIIQSQFSPEKRHVVHDIQFISQICKLRDKYAN